MVETDELAILEKIIESVGLSKYIIKMNLSEVLKEFSEDIKDIIKEREFEDLKEKGINKITFKDLLDYDIATDIVKNSMTDNYCNVYVDEVSKTFVLFYKEDYQKQKERRLFK